MEFPGCEVRLEEGEPWARCVQETERGSPGGLRAHLGGSELTWRLGRLRVHRREWMG